MSWSLFATKSGQAPIGERRERVRQPSGVLRCDYGTLQAFDQGGRARAFATMIEGLAAAKVAGLSADTVKMAFAFIDEGTGETLKR